ncbi:hypothetical protein LOK49_LG05G02184 [Camellia lanceoleosa]|uniref:Uncharacterized protein n=1 Tax=Camellia lanceoleosa TaxID=1840588 RepID=A0ACC0HQ06_9ERIC|nr:hypothetical protein LOK49_LG05G02184 [Camellia lanceoleosa]
MLGKWTLYHKCAELMQVYGDLPGGTYLATLGVLRNEKDTMLLYFPTMPQKQRLEWFLQITPPRSMEEMKNWMKKKAKEIPFVGMEELKNWMDEMAK